MDLVEREHRSAGSLTNYAEGGAGDTPLVLVHGLTLDWHTMDEQISALGSIAHIYACDLLGHGRSDWTDKGYAVAEYVDQISAFVREVSGRGSVVVGFSLGALVAIGVAARVPDLVVGVAAVDPPLISRNSDFDAFSYSGAHDWIQWVDDVNGGRLAPSEAEARFLRMFPEGSRADAQQAMRDISSVDPRATARIVAGRTFEGFDLQAELGALSCPSLLLAGEVGRGSLVRDEDLDFFTAHTAHGRTSRVLGGGHDIIWGATAATVNTELVDWLRGLTQAGLPAGYADPAP
jgi:pimeloyl-ACP methyl ester carboxylesterase